MSVETLVRPAAQKDSDVIDVLAALRANGDALAELLDGVFDDLELLGGEVDLRTRLLEEARCHAAEQASELQSVRHAEALAKAELTTVRREIEQAHGQLAGLPQKNDELREHLHALELERCSLETEMEALRVRSAELADHLAEAKRESSEERAEWSSELKQLRRTLERHTELLADRLATAQAIDRSPGQASAAEIGPHNLQESAPTVAANGSQTNKDTVLGSVIAQFETLQRDRQRRRGQ